MGEIIAGNQDSPVLLSNAHPPFPWPPDSQKCQFYSYEKNS